MSFFPPRFVGDFELLKTLSLWESMIDFLNHLVVQIIQFGVELWIYLILQLFKIVDVKLFVLVAVVAANLLNCISYELINHHLDKLLVIVSFQQTKIHQWVKRLGIRGLNVEELFFRESQKHRVEAGYNSSAVMAFVLGYLDVHHLSHYIVFSNLPALKVLDEALVVGWVVFKAHFI